MKINAIKIRNLVLVALIGFFLCQVVQIKALADDATTSGHSEIVATLTPTPSISLTPTQEVSAQPTSSITPSPTSTPSISTSLQVSPSPTPTPVASSSGNTNMNTGPATSSADTLSIVNANTINSAINVNTNNVTSGSGDIVPPNITPTTAAISGNITNNNTATNTAIASASANTGNNSQTSSGNTNLTTGDAFATANSITITNVNLVNSLLQLGVINVYQTWNGNLILAPVSPSSGSATLADVQNNNTAYITTSAQSLATTGGNTQNSSGSADMTTGTATSVSTVKSIANVNLYNAYIFQMLFTNPNLWTGMVYNFAYPGSRQTVPEFLAYLASHSEYQSLLSTPSALQITNNNTAYVTTAAYASANTGGNTQNSSGSASMQTGNAFAAATALSFTNLNLVNSVFRWELINLFQPWTGNLIFAYPDLVVSIQAPDHVTEGTTIPYTFTVTNIGYAPATHITSEESVDQENDHKTLAQQTTNLPDLLPGESITHTVNIDSSGLGTQVLDFNTQVHTDSTEEFTDNNTANASTDIWPAGSNNSASNTPAPKLTLNVHNNINDYVYAGDHVRYSVDVTNSDNVTANSVVFSQTLNDFNHNQQSQFNIPLGSLRPGKTVHLNYELALDPKLTAGNYYTNSQATSFSDNNNSQNTDIVVNLIPLKGEQTNPIITALVPQAHASSGIDLPSLNTPGQVLGSSISRSPYWNWIVLLVLLILAFIYILSKKLKSHLITLSIGLFFIVTSLGIGFTAGGTQNKIYGENKPIIIQSSKSKPILLAQSTPNPSATPTPTPTNFALTGGQSNNSPITQSSFSLNLKPINIDIPITKAQIQDGQWIVPDNSVSMYSQNGNTVIYGHDWPNLLGKLSTLKDGDEIQIQTKQKVQSYKIDQVYIVSPDDLSVLDTDKKGLLFIYTCAGADDNRRFIIRAEKN